MDCPEDVLTTERSDDPLYLPPVAKTRHVAIVAAALSTCRGLEPGVVAVALDQVGSVRQRDAAMDEGALHGACLAPSRFPTADDRRQRAVSHLFSEGLGDRSLAWHGLAMPSSSRAGGCFLTICILAGFPLGLAMGNPMKGILIGTGCGILLAVATWLIDRARRN